MAATRSPTKTVTLVRWSAGPRAGDTLDIDALAAEAGLHPDVVRRFVDLGLLAPVPGPGREPRFPRGAAAVRGRGAALPARRRGDPRLCPAPAARPRHRLRGSRARVRAALAHRRPANA